MALPVTMDATWLNPGTVQYNAQELRQADSAMFGGTGSGYAVRGGIVRHSDTALAVTVNASDVVTIQPGAVVIPGNSGTSNGCYRAGLGVATTGNLAARNATNPRIDLVVFRVLDDDVVTTHDAYTGRIEIIAGAAAASPVAPALPTLAVELARITVPATSGGAASVDATFRPYATAVEGRLAVATAARLPATDSKWTRAVALDTGLEYVWSGTAWVVQDTGWVALPAATGFTSSAFYRVKDGQVWFRGTMQKNSGNILVNDVLSNLPAIAQTTQSALLWGSFAAASVRLQADTNLTVTAIPTGMGSAVGLQTNPYLAGA